MISVPFGKKVNTVPQVADGVIWIGNLSEMSPAMHTATLKAQSAEKIEAVKNAFKSRQGFMDLVTVQDTALDQHGHPGSDKRWSNEDL